MTLLIDDVIRIIKEQGEELRMKDCKNSMAPSDEDLLRLALDEEPLRKETREHLEQCLICRQRLAMYTRTSDQLLSKLYRSTCPTVTQLNLYCAGLLSGDEGMGIVYHIAECPLCVREMVTIRQVLADFEPFPTLEKIEAPQRVVERIIAAFVPWKPQLVTRGGPVFDGPWPRQYRAGEINISLHLSRGSNGEIILLGLFTSDDPDEALEEQEGILVDLYQASNLPTTQNARHGEDSQSGQPMLSAKIDDLGNVVFKAVPIGVYAMVVRLPESEVVIEGLCIESS